MKRLSQTGWMVFLLAVGFSCTKIQSFPPIPEIEFESFYLVDTLILGNPGQMGFLRFSFVDGDGDIGWNEEYPPPPENPEGKNLFFTMFEKVDGLFYKVEDERLPDSISYIIPYLESVGQNKTLKGEVIVEFQYLLFDFDTIRYDFYLIDRALHSSNVESTPVIVLK